jgi:hypothetical protein
VQAIANRLPPEPDPPDAAEGTAAHKWLEHYLGGCGKPEVDIPNDQKILLSQVADDIEWYAETMGYSIQTEVEYTLTFELSNGARHEMKLHADIVLRNETDLIVLDYKHGPGRPVEVRGNSQTRLYLLGAVSSLPQGHTVNNFSMGIIQPRGRGEGWQQVVVSREELQQTEVEAYAAIERAYADRVEYIPGPHCWRCPGRRGLCPAVLTDAIDCCVIVPQKVQSKDLTIETLADMFGGVLPWRLLDIAAETKTFLKTLEDYADVWLKSGKTISGWGLESSHGRRSWENPEEVPGVLTELLGGRVEDYQKIKPPAPINLTDAERIAKRKGVKIDGLIKKPVVQKRVKMENSGSLGFSPVE